MTILERIAQAQPRLTPTERKIASAITSEPTLVAFGTVSDLADRIQTSRPSIVRFAQKLGCDGYPELQQMARDSLSTKLTRPSDRFRASDSEQPDYLDSLESVVGQLGEIIATDQLESTATSIQQARAVWILSGETSKAGAHVLQSGLSMLLPRVTLLEQHRMGQELAGATSDDVAIVVDFYRYRKAAVLGVRACSRIGMPVIAITDGPLSPVASVAEQLFVLDVSAVGPFDSAVPAVAMAELFVAEVARLGHDEVQGRIDRTEQLWRETETFDPEPD